MAYKRLCFDCIHYRAWDGSPGYSEYTPGDAPNLECHKGHWEFDGFAVSELKNMLTKAETCSDYSTEKVG